MASSLLALLDDIATILDDVSVMTKVAAQKTAGVLGDDLALNAQQVSGVKADRELPVVWAVAKGSALNKLILVPLALAISAFAPQLVSPLLMVGGAFLCFEGVEKVAHKLLHSSKEEQAHHAQLIEHNSQTTADIVALEKEKIKGAVRTDFILSAEIIVISLGTMQSQPILEQVVALLLVAALMTVGVYGIVALIVKLDDVGLFLSQKSANLPRKTGQALLGSVPYLMRGLAIAGTLAMFLVGGGIMVHGAPWLHHVQEYFLTQLPKQLQFLGEQLVALTIGFMVGALILLCVQGVKRLKLRH